MPRVPTAFYPRSGASPALGAGVVPRGAQELANTLNQGISEIGGAIVEQAHERLVLEARTAGLRAINDAQQAAEDPGVAPEDMISTFEEGATRGLADAKNQLGDFQSYAPKLEGEFRLMTEARRASLLDKQLARTEDAQIRALNEHLDETQHAIMLTNSGAEAALLEQSGLAMIEQAPIPEQAKGKLASTYLRNTDLNAAMRILKENPARLLHASSDLAGFATAFPHLTQQDAFRLSTSAQIELNRRETAAREGQAQQQEVEVNHWLGRMYGPIDQMPTIPEVLDSGLKPSAKEHFIGLLEKRSRGGVDASNPLAVSDTFHRVHNGEITSDSQLSELVGKGLSIEDYKKASADLKAMQRPIRREQFKQLDDLLAVAKGVMAPSSLMKAAQPEALLRYGRFEKAARDRFEQEIEAGRDPRTTILDPASPDYLGTPERMPVMGAREQFDVGRKARSFQPAPAPTVPPRKEGQSAEDWLRETEQGK